MKDGKDGQISFKDGRPTVTTKNKGKQGSLEEFLGLQAGTGYSALMKDAGFRYDNTSKTWTVSGKTIRADAIKQLASQGLITNTEIIQPQGFFSGAINVINYAKNLAGPLLSRFKNFFSREEKPDVSQRLRELEKRFREVEGMPYATKDKFRELQDLDENRVVTKDSRGMNCIGFLSYMFGFGADYSVEFFERYSMFEKLPIPTVGNLDGLGNLDDLGDLDDLLSIGDVIRWRGTQTNGIINNHVQIWAGNEKVWESVYDIGVRSEKFSRIANWYRNNAPRYQVDFFRYKD